MAKDELSRRGAIGALAGVVVGAALPGNAAATDCKVTAAQTEGPFYPTGDRADKDNDLTSVKGRTGRARGEVIYLFGRVLDEHCKPVEGALVEIWQACQSGRYDHERDSNAAPLDPDFQYWGRFVTDARGQYAFKTIVPGAYPATPDWMRPPHIHFKVARRGYREVTSQLYFADHALNGKDFILRDLPAAERARLTVRYTAPARGFKPAEVSNFTQLDPGAKVGTCDLTIKSVMTSYGEYGK
jgi:protocatechuate 3,4-dioxygenase beta subunit